MVRGIERGMEETDTGALGASPVGKMGGGIAKPIHKSNVEPDLIIKRYNTKKTAATPSSFRLC